MSGQSVKEIPCERAMTKLKRKIPYGWDLNAYRGCAHGCKYCYAVYSHDYLEGGAFDRDIYVKRDILEKLERELGSPSWKREVVNLGGVTDSYQKAEETLKLMPEILKLLIRYKTPAIISTKSVLPQRDYDLIDELSRITYINIAATVTTMDEAVRELLEPGAAPSAERFAMLKEFRKTNASIGVHLMPIIPLLTDSRENLEEILSRSKDCGADYVLPGTLYLRGPTKEIFLRFMKENYPDKFEELTRMYGKGGAGKDYKEALYSMLLPLRAAYGLSGSYSKPMKEKLRAAAEEEEQQLSF